ncbi:unnamed protein product [Mytilus coruscus]|uniref:MAM domain-containing protein n=1 Tax=Mytilus coruscus TaxID=42192 RepID=A0A6J8DUX6_MYTCO|nr:unnamed protein product [Mytilus coruscus]
MTIECETQFLAGNITLTFQQENLAIYQKNCRENSIENELNTFCRTFNKSDQCKFRLLDFMNKYEDCIVFSKNISVTYQCIGIVAGVSGGVLVTIIAVFVICRIKRSKPYKQEASIGNGNKAFDELQYDEKSKLNPTSSQCLGQDKITQNNSNLNIPKKLDQGGQEPTDLYNMSNEDGTYDISSNDKQRKTKMITKYTVTRQTIFMILEVITSYQTEMKKRMIISSDSKQKMNITPPREQLVTTIQYPDENTVNISCWNTSLIQIQNISVQVEETTCGPNPCVLNYNDTQTVEDNCDGRNSCLMDYNLTSACLREFRYINLSFTCKHEDSTSLSTFEADFGDWMVDSSNGTTWERKAFVRDHTRVNLYIDGYSINAFSYGGKAGTTRIDSEKEFVEPICLSLWYQLYDNAFDCFFSIYKITDGNQTLLFTVDGNSSIFNTWINKSVDVYGQDPFKIVLEADFQQRNSTAARAVLIDDTSIAYRPCEGKCEVE